MTVRLTFRFPTESTLVAPTLATAVAAQVEWAKAAHEIELRGCEYCQMVGHCIWWRGYPVTDPGPRPPEGVLDELVEACFCCFWGPGPTRTGEPLHARLTREAHDGRDVTVEHRTKAGLWVRFEERFGAVA